MLTVQEANYQLLSPITYLERSAKVFRNKVAVVYKDTERTYAEFASRCYRLANSLKSAGIKRGDTVAFLCPNIPPMLEAHYAVPLAGAKLCAINIRLSQKEIEFIINHSGAKAVFVDTELADKVRKVRGNLKNVKFFVNIRDINTHEPLDDAFDYDEFVRQGAPDRIPNPIDDENDPITINYTSGTTGNPKGVVYTHRSAYLNCLGSALAAEFTNRTRFLWVVPMFHCNGWCFTWGVTAVGGTHVCLRKPDPADIIRLIMRERITMFGAAPVILIGLYSSPDASKLKIDWPLVVFTGGAPPSPTTLNEMRKLNIDIRHLYGLTETYGPHTLCEWQDRFNELNEDHQFRLMARQGVASITAAEVRVVREDMTDVEPDGTELGEVVMRGNNVMLGYYNNPESTEEAFRGGWFHSGDVAVMHSDNYIELRDRSKDVIISGGENISSIEVENALYRHPDVLECAVVAKPDDKWGEVPKAFIKLKNGKTPAPESIMEFLRGEIAGFKVPREIEFCELPKTSTGKVKKFALREKEWAGQEKRVH